MVLMWLFDPKQKDLRDLDLAELEEGLDEEDAVMIAEMTSEVNGQATQTDNTKGWVDEVEALSDIEQCHLQALIHPIRLAVGKVSEYTYLSQVIHCLEQLHKLAFKIIHSTIIILPAWRQICHNLDLEPHLIPCDVSIHWNLCCDMVDVGTPRRWWMELQCRDLGLSEVTQGEHQGQMLLVRLEGYQRAGKTE